MAESCVAKSEPKPTTASHDAAKIYVDGKSNMGRKGKKAENNGESGKSSDVADKWKLPSLPRFRGVDERADEFIAKFRNDMKLEREQSILEFQEMLKRRLVSSKDIFALPGPTYGSRALHTPIRAQPLQQVAFITDSPETVEISRNKRAIKGSAQNRNKARQSKKERQRKEETRLPFPPELPLSTSRTSRNRRAHSEAMMAKQRADKQVAEFIKKNLYRGRFRRAAKSLYKDETKKTKLPTHTRNREGSITATVTADRAINVGASKNGAASCEVKSGVAEMNSGAAARVLINEDTMTFDVSDIVKHTAPRKSHVQTANRELAPDIRMEEIIGRGTERRGLYYVDEIAPKGVAMLTHGPGNREAWLWHRWLV
ncbi:cotton fiber protein [Perilla frutescens var. hirtella]|nr:cotton fiber protein [Perilla frutescens var. hirtella]